MNTSMLRHTIPCITERTALCFNSIQTLYLHVDGIPVNLQLIFPRVIQMYEQYNIFKHRHQCYFRIISNKPWLLKAGSALIIVMDRQRWI